MARIALRSEQTTFLRAQIWCRTARSLLATMPTPKELFEEREQRKALMQTSNWIAAKEGGQVEYLPVSSTPLDLSYQRSKSQTRSGYLEKMATETAAARSTTTKHCPASTWVVGKKYDITSPGTSAVDTTIVLGSDPRELGISSTIIGSSQNVPVEPIDLTYRVDPLRDSTLDGSHRASMMENHFLSIWDPYDSMHKSRSASFKSSVQLRDAHHRHIRSQYHPEEKYNLPPTAQNDIGWGLTPERYKEACSKYQEGAEWHGRSGSHITKFAERLALGARHHLSGPMTKPSLHY